MSKRRPWPDPGWSAIGKKVCSTESFLDKKYTRQNIMLTKAIKTT
jgi:hypothetical protein